jgi:hypothetical protein
MARYRYARRLRRGLRGRNGRFAASATAAGVVLAVIAGHHAGAAPGTGRGGAAAASCTSCSANERLANSMAASGYGWTGGQVTCLDELWTEESAGTWSPAVSNPASGAYGIPQAPGRTGRPARPRRSAGAWATSRAGTARPAPPGLLRNPMSRTGTEPGPEGKPP